MSRTGKRLTPELLKSRIVEVQYEDREVLGQRMVTANFKMDNGFVVYGKNPSTSIDPARFDIELGKKLAYEKTLEQLWELETYRALSESVLFEVACGIDIDVFKYRVESSERFAVPHEMSGAFAVNVVFQAPGLDGHCKPMKYVATLIQPTEHLSFEDHNAKVLDKVRDYLIRNIPLEHMYPQLVVRIAKVCHEANRAYCQAIGDTTQQPWEMAEEWQRRSSCEGVLAHLAMTLSPEESHQEWCKLKYADGWVYGDVKDAEGKTHPCLVPYEKLPEFQRAKDMIFSAIVNSFK